MTLFLSLLALLLAPPADCDTSGSTYGDRPTACEVRTFTLPATGVLAVGNDVSGGVRVIGWDRDEVSVQTTLRAYGSDGRSPTDLLAATTIETDGTLRNVTEGGGWVDVAYEIRVPRDTDLNVETRNGALTVDGVTGTHRLFTRNGALRLTGVGGDVTAETANGAVTVTALGTTWDGAGLHVETRNGNVRLVVPDGYDALVDAATGYGSIGEPEADVRWARETSQRYLGAGGPTLRLRTRMGHVRIARG